MKINTVMNYVLSAALLLATWLWNASIYDLKNVVAGHAELVRKRNKQIESLEAKLAGQQRGCEQVRDDWENCYEQLRECRYPAKGTDDVHGNDGD